MWMHRQDITFSALYFISTPLIVKSRYMYAGNKFIYDQICVIFCLLTSGEGSLNTCKWSFLACPLNTFSIEFIEAEEGRTYAVVPGVIVRRRWIDWQIAFRVEVRTEGDRTSKRSCSRCKRAKYPSQPLDCCSKVLKRDGISCSFVPLRGQR